MHLKNWSMLYPDGIHPRLSPAYDFVSTIPYLANDSLALNFGGSKDLYALTKTQIRRFADTAHLPTHSLYALAQETIDRTHDAWKTLPEKSLLPQGLKETIGEHIMKMASGNQ